MHSAFRLPERSTELAGGLDIFMPASGSISGTNSQKVGLGFAAEVPVGHVGILLPRSGVGFKTGLELNNTAGVIDPDYRGEWFASMRTKGGQPLSWLAGERLLQLLVVPVTFVTPELVQSLDATARGEGGLGSTGR